MAMAKAFAAALRNLRRAPAFTGLVVLTLALGIGATTAIFGGIVIVLGAVALLACAVPALKASRVDPMTTLRAE